MKGILVTNHYLVGEKFDTLHRHLITTAADCGIRMEHITNRDMTFWNDSADFVLFWDKDVNLARLLESRGIPVFNNADAIALCDDKSAAYSRLFGVVPQPKTISAPMSFFDVDYTDFVQQAVAELGLPLVYKECRGSFGEQVHLCHSVEDIASHIDGKPFLLQEYIGCGGSDVRIEVVGDRCVAAMKRHNNSDFRSNITNGGTAVAYTPTDAQCRLALDACRRLGLDFGGVDIIGDNMVCEVNSNAHIINIMDCTGVDAAVEIFEYIKGQR